MQKQPCTTDELIAMDGDGRRRGGGRGGGRGGRRRGGQGEALVDTADEWITMDGDGGRDNERQQRALRNN